MNTDLITNQESLLGYLQEKWYDLRYGPRLDPNRKDYVFNSQDLRRHISALEYTSKYLDKAVLNHDEKEIDKNIADLLAYTNKHIRFIPFLSRGFNTSLLTLFTINQNVPKDKSKDIYYLVDENYIEPSRYAKLKGPKGDTLPSLKQKTINRVAELTEYYEDMTVVKVFLLGHDVLGDIYKPAYLVYFYYDDENISDFTRNFNWDSIKTQEELRSVLLKNHNLLQDIEVMYDQAGGTEYQVEPYKFIDLHRVLFNKADLKKGLDGRILFYKAIVDKMVNFSRPISRDEDTTISPYANIERNTYFLITQMITYEAKLAHLILKTYDNINMEEINVPVVEDTIVEQEEILPSEDPKLDPVEMPVEDLIHYEENENDILLAQQELIETSQVLDKTVNLVEDLENKIEEYKSNNDPTVNDVVVVQEALERALALTGISIEKEVITTEDIMSNTPLAMSVNLEGIGSVLTILWDFIKKLWDKIYGFLIKLGELIEIRFGSFTLLAKNIRQRLSKLPDTPRRIPFDILQNISTSAYYLLTTNYTKGIKFILSDASNTINTLRNNVIDYKDLTVEHPDAAQWFSKKVYEPLARFTNSSYGYGSLNNHLELLKTASTPIPHDSILYIAYDSRDRIKVYTYKNKTNTQVASGIDINILSIKDDIVDKLSKLRFTTTNIINMAGILLDEKSMGYIKKELSDFKNSTMRAKKELESVIRNADKSSSITNTVALRTYRNANSAIIIYIQSILKTLHLLKDTYGVLNAYVKYGVE